MFRQKVEEFDVRIKAPEHDHEEDVNDSILLSTLSITLMNN